MQYKTIMLQFLEQRTEIHDRLRQSRTLLPTLDLLANQLKASHEAWKTRLNHTKPGSSPSQIASEAMELALKEMEDRLSSGSSPDATAPLSLEATMAFIKGRTPPE